MKCYVINLRGARRVFPLVKLLALMLVFVSIVYVVSESVFYTSEYVFAMQAESEKNTIIIDAGHGGEDSGAVGADGTLEKNLNLEIASELGRQLTERGFAVVYTRTDDKMLYNEDENINGIRKLSDLKNRCKIAAEYPNAIFISIHQNSYGSSKYSGLQVYYKPDDKQSATLASYIQSSVKNELQTENNRSVKSGKGLYLLENSENTSVIIECGFLSNTEECKKLSEKEYQKELCLAIICGIMEYKGK